MVLPDMCLFMEEDVVLLGLGVIFFVEKDIPEEGEGWRGLIQPDEGIGGGAMGRALADEFGEGEDGGGEPDEEDRRPEEVYTGDDHRAEVDFLRAGLAGGGEDRGGGGVFDETGGRDIG